jgi:hypothetical protein
LLYILFLFLLFLTRINHLAFLIRLASLGGHSSDIMR